LKDNSNELNTNRSNNNSDLNNKTIIQSHDYYNKISNDLTLKIYKYHSLAQFKQAFDAGFNKLTEMEKRIVLLNYNFCNDNYLLVPSVDHYFKSKLKNQSIDKWLKDNFNSLNNNKTSLFNRFKCDLCDDSGFTFDNNQININIIYCQRGHSMSRCIKSLLPLNNFKFYQCKICGSYWNTFEATDFANFESFNINEKQCLFCK
jgi:ribosomal protein S27E